jgi:hypothetical protein
MVGRGVKKTTMDTTIRILQHPISRILTAPIFYLSSVGLKGPLVTVTAVKRLDQYD